MRPDSTSLIISVSNVLQLELFFHSERESSLTLSILYRRHVLLQRLASGACEGVRCRAVAMMHKIRRNHFVQDHSPIALVIRQGKIINSGFGRRPQLLQHVFDVELERFLAEVCVHHFARGLQSHCGI